MRHCREIADIAVQRKSPYHRRAIHEFRNMNTAPAKLPPDAELASTAGFNLFAGPFYRLGDDGEARRFAFIALDKHMNAAGSVHGGLLMTFADIAMSRTSRLVSGAKSCSTVSVSCDFVSAGRLGDLIEIRVRVTRQTRTLVFLSSEIAANGAVLMVANGLWRIVRE
jgi:acyl-coenzyme A thioesterase PaaI-like protein